MLPFSACIPTFDVGFCVQPLEPRFRNGPQLHYYVNLLNDGNCLIEPHGFTSPLVELVRHDDVATWLNVTARRACAFNFSVQAANKLGMTLDSPRSVTVTADDAGGRCFCVQLIRLLEHGQL